MFNACVDVVLWQTWCFVGDGRALNAEHRRRLWIRNRQRSADLFCQHALAEVAKALALFHSTTTVSRIAVSGTPRKASSRRSSRIRAIAPQRLARASCAV